jgi:glutaredoxin
MLDAPTDQGYTIYSRSGCCNCDKAKKKIEEGKRPLLYINCDDELIEDRESCLTNLKLYAGKTITQFPVIFFDGEFIGSWKDLNLHLECN